MHPAACKLAAGQGEHHATCSSPQHKRIKGPIPIKQARQSNERKLYRCNDQSSILYVQAWKKEKEHQSRAAKSCSAALSLSSTPPAAVPLFELEHTHHLSLSMIGTGRWENTSSDEMGTSRGEDADERREEEDSKNKRKKYESKLESLKNGPHISYEK